MARSKTHTTIDPDEGDEGDGERPMALRPLSEIMKSRPKGLERDDQLPLTKPYEPVDFDNIPEVVEDGTTGLVWWKFEDIEGVGPARLRRGDRIERLFRGRWVRMETAEQYAHEHGHDFEVS